MQFSPLLIPGTPRGGREKLTELIDTVVLAEELGFDGIWLNEHHACEYGRPVPATLLANAAARTSTIRLGIAVVVLPWHHPLEVAEQLAVVDHLSNGRVEAGFGRGLFPGEFGAFASPMSQARERFAESLDFVIRAWTGETASLDGEFWKIPEIEVLPKPLQSPHPRVWIAATSASTVDMVVSKGFNGLIGPYLTPLEDIKNSFLDPWHQMLDSKGVAPGTLRCGHNQHVYVAETDEKAREECAEHIRWYLKTLATQCPEDVVVNGISQYKEYGGFREYLLGLDGDFLFNERMLVGSPDTVAEKIRYLRDEGNLDMLIPFMNFGTLPFELVKKSMTLFAREVMPEFQRSEVASATGAP